MSASTKHPDAPEIPYPEQENPPFPSWKRPKDKTLGEWLQTRVARRATRTYDWNALGWQAEVDPKYRRAQTRYIGVGQPAPRMIRTPCRRSISPSPP